MLFAIYLALFQKGTVFLMIFGSKGDPKYFKTIEYSSGTRFFLLNRKCLRVGAKYKNVCMGGVLEKNVWGIKISEVYYQ